MSDILRKLMELEGKALGRKNICLNIYTDLHDEVREYCFFNKITLYEFYEEAIYRHLEKLKK